MPEATKCRYHNPLTLLSKNYQTYMIWNNLLTFQCSIKEVKILFGFWLHAPFKFFFDSCCSVLLFLVSLLSSKWKRNTILSMKKMSLNTFDEHLANPRKINSGQGVNIWWISKIWAHLFFVCFCYFLLQSW